MFLGAGGAAIGIATLLQRELVAEGMDPRAAAAAIVMLDSHGLVHTDRPGLPDDQRPFAVDPGALLEAGLRPSELVDPVADRARHAVDGAHRRDGLFGRVLRGPRPGGGAPRPASRSSCRCRTRAPAPRRSRKTSSPGPKGAPWSPRVARAARSTAPAGRGSIGQANNVFIFPGDGAWGDRRRDARGDRRDVPRRRPRAGRSRVGRALAERARSTRPSPDLRAVARAIAIAVAREARDGGLGRAIVRSRRSRRRSIARCGGPSTCRSSPAADRAERWLAIPGGEGDHVALHRRAQTRSKAIATDPPPPRQRVARP